MISYDLLIPSSGLLPAIKKLVMSLQYQRSRPERVIVLVWQECTVLALQQFAHTLHAIVDPLGIELIVQHAHYSDHQQGSGVGYDRWFLVTQAIAPYLCMIDEDNVLPAGQLDEWIIGYHKIIEKLGHEAIVSPTIMRHGQIQSQGITGFSYLFPRFLYSRCSGPRQEVIMLGANSLFGRTEIFQQIQFDPLFAGSYEDIDFSSRLVKAGYGLVVLGDVHIDHQERQKSFLETLFLDTPTNAFYRSRNRILRVRKIASLWGKIQYFGCGMRLQTVGWMWYLVRAQHLEKLKIIGAIFRGIRTGLTKKLPKSVIP